MICLVLVLLYFKFLSFQLKKLHDIKKLEIRYPETESEIRNLASKIRQHPDSGKFHIQYIPN